MINKIYFAFPLIIGNANIQITRAEKKMLKWHFCYILSLKCGAIHNVTGKQSDEPRYCYCLYSDCIHGCLTWASVIAQLVKNLPAVQETRVCFLGGKDPLENEMATHSSILAWKISWTEEPGRLQSMGRKSWTRLGDYTTSTTTMPYLNKKSWKNR